MGYLSDALKPYYKKSKNRIVFTGGLSLSNLAMQMWEALGFQQIDASVLSRVLNGERLFTPRQLDIFCRILALTTTQKEYLFSCLSKDYFKRDNITLDIGSQDHSMYVIEKLIENAIDLFYVGKSYAVMRQNDVINSFYEKINLPVLSLAEIKNFYELYGYYVFLRDRSVAGTFSRYQAIRLIHPTANFLENISREYNLKNLHAYSQILFADIAYLNAKYVNKEKYYRQALFSAFEAYATLESIHREKLAALRLMIACSYYVKREDTIRLAEKDLKKLITKQPIENIVNAIHASIALTKGKVLLGDDHPFALEDAIGKYFYGAQLPTGAYFEISGIKTRIATFSLVTTDKKILLPLIERGIALSSAGKYPQHRQYFKKQLKQWS